MAAKIKDIKVWKNATKTECRVYVHMDDGREGCRYLTGNHWHAAKSVEGTLTDEEWKSARALAYYDNRWHTIYENELHAVAQPAQPARRQRCPDCGGYDCGANCNANRWPSQPATGDGQEHARWETEEALADLGL